MKQHDWNRRLSAGLVAAGLILTLAGCGNTKAEESAPPESTAPVQTEPVETQEAQPVESTPLPEVTEPAESKTPAEEKPADDSQTETGSYSHVTAIGDSVMLGAEVEMENRMPGCIVDADESRQIWDGKDVAQQLAAQGKLGDTVILALGTNCTFKMSTARELLDYFGDRTVYWVTAYGEKLSWQDEVNATIEAVSAEYDNVHVLHWDEVGPQHPEWFYGDGLHLNGEGRIGYAEFLKSSLDAAS